MVALVPDRKVQISEEAVISQRPSQQVDPRLPQDPGEATAHQQMGGAVKRCNKCFFC